MDVGAGGAVPALSVCFSVIVGALFCTTGVVLSVPFSEDALGVFSADFSIPDFCGCAVCVVLFSGRFVGTTGAGFSVALDGVEVLAKGLAVSV